MIGHKELETRQRYGLPALFEELSNQGVTQQAVLADAGLESADVALSFHERLSLFRSAQRLAKNPETALRAGQRQQISYYGAYGYAIATSETLADAWRVGRDFFSLSGSLFRISLDIEDGVGVYRSYNPESLGPVLPFVAEYWRSSQSKMFALVLGREFPSLQMRFPYSAPRHAALYKEVFGCPVHFGCERMEWHFDASVLTERCNAADPGVAQLCEDYCEQLVDRSEGKSLFQQQILRTCARNLSSAKVQASAVAKALNVSVRTLHRRLGDEGVSYLALLDRLRSSVALEYLRNTNIPIEEIASRCGYGDVSNFRKAFRRWTGNAPSFYRASWEAR
ncbi:MAG: AraC family transcriptional regulator ligand-binding domain-containing protein [Chloroflexota bacterium]|nr:AraC family transcriptional regulator ligand-binding domain-containing protein [Chloroflexota bacterium]